MVYIEDIYFSYKIAERCMMSCIAKYPIHKLRSPTAPFIKRNSEYNKYLRVYIHLQMQSQSNDNTKKLRETAKMCKMNLDDVLE